jgi:hypothetical protein
VQAGGPTAGLSLGPMFYAVGTILSDVTHLETPAAVPIAQPETQTTPVPIPDAKAPTPSNQNAVDAPQAQKTPTDSDQPTAVKGSEPSTASLIPANTIVAHSITIGRLTEVYTTTFSGTSDYTAVVTLTSVYSTAVSGTLQTYSPRETSLSGGAIAGIVIAFLLLTAFVIGWYVVRRRQKSTSLSGDVEKPTLPNNSTSTLDPFADTNALIAPKRFKSIKRKPVPPLPPIIPSISSDSDTSSNRRRKRSSLTLFPTPPRTTPRASYSMEGLATGTMRTFTPPPIRGSNGYTSDPGFRPRSLQTGPEIPQKGRRISGFGKSRSATPTSFEPRLNLGTTASFEPRLASSNPFVDPVPDGRRSRTPPIHRNDGRNGIPSTDRGQQGKRASIFHEDI